MKTITFPNSMAACSTRWHREGVTIGFVPTMGALHAGHRVLIRDARRSCDAVVVSLFVNPAQFGPSEDLSRYPRQLREDRALCRSEGVDVLFTPTTTAMYPPGYQTTVTVPDLARRWEGESRPYHFQGVSTIVTKLLCLLRPEKAWFGQKDYQQALIVGRLVEDLNLGTKIVIQPTVRETDGLALSSRNVYLTERERRAAPILYRALQAGRTAIRSGLLTQRDIHRVMRAVLATEALVRQEYLDVCEAKTLEPVKQVRNTVVLLGAVRIGGTHLIDNVLVKFSPRPS